MSSSSSNLALFFLAICLFSSLPVLHARDINFFSKTTHTTTAETQLPNEPSKQQGYGLYGHGARNAAAEEKEEETYEYQPTTSNPNDRMDSYSESGNIGNRWIGQEMRKKKPQFSTEGEGDQRRSHHGEIYSTNNKNSLFYGTVERQGMSDTRFLENGKYYYDISNEENNKYGDTAFDSNNGQHDIDVEEEDGHDKMYEYQNNKINSNNNNNQNLNQNKYNHNGRKQGMSDTRYMTKGKYYYDDINKEKEVYDNRDEKKVFDNFNMENDKSNDAAVRYDFRNTVNKFPKYEFDSMEEYMKQNGYNH